MRRTIAVWAVLAASCSAAAPATTDPATADHAAVDPPPTTNLTVFGSRIVDGEAFLTAAEDVSRFRSLPDARCYFSTFDDVELNPFIRCGPAIPQIKTALGAWRTFVIQADQGVAGVELARVLDAGPGFQLLPNELLIRPDGASPPPKDQIALPGPTGQAWVTVWHALDSWFHYCMADSAVFAFDPEFRFDEQRRSDLQWDEVVEVVQLVRYSRAQFGGPEENQTLMAIEASCIDEVAQRAGASFGEVAE